MTNIPYNPPQTRPAPPGSEAPQAALFFALGRRAIIRSVKREATFLIECGPCYRQSKLLDALYGPFAWKAENHLPADDEISKQVANEMRMAAANYWCADGNRLIALRGHLLARRYDRRFGT